MKDISAFNLDIQVPVEITPQGRDVVVLAQEPRKIIALDAARFAQDIVYIINIMD
jgi:hypothetical protein